MPAPQSLAMLLVALLLGVAEGTSHLGYCSDGASSTCRWEDYLRDVLLQGLYGWVIAGLVAVTFVVYVFFCFIRCCYRCCCGRKPPTVGQQLYVYQLIRLFAWVALLAAGAGLAVSLIGWFRVTTSYNSAWAAVTTFTTTLINLMLVLQSELRTMQPQLVSAATYLNMPELKSVVTSDAVSSSVSFALDVNSAIKDVHDIADIVFLVYRWTIVGFFAMVVGVAIVFALFTLCYKALRCSSTCLILLALLAAFLMWLSVGVAVVGNRILTDSCADLTESLGDPNKGSGILDQLKCDRNNNSFSVVYNTYTQGAVSLNQSFCAAVAATCKTSTTVLLSSCTCRSDGDTERFLAETAVFGDTQCVANCSAAACATRCALARQHNVSSALADISATRAALVRNQ
eukprot:EG_transcript_15329